jgi:3-phosphoshikimate 1-carboxyvinyltransferase
VTKYITGSALCGTAAAPPSKSHAHRLLLAAALCGTPTLLRGTGDSEDVAATAGCLESLGVTTEKTAEGLCVLPACPGAAGKNAGAPAVRCNARESGSTLRFLLPVLGALGAGGRIRGEGLLLRRPSEEFYRLLTRHGMRIDEAGDELILSGGLRAGEYVLDGGISSQFVTGLLFALPLLAGDSRLIVTGKAVSRPYVGMTLRVLRQFGVTIEEKASEYRVPGGQSYRSPGVCDTEGDWSGAAFLLAAGALTGDVSVFGLNAASDQGDKRIFDILRDMCADIRREGGSVRARRSKLRAIELDAEDIPDLVPAVSVLCGAAEGVSAIAGAGRLRFKESDRLSAVLQMLEGFGIRAAYTGGRLVIRGGLLLSGSPNLPPDHRMVMAASVAALAAEGVSAIENAGAVGKSYPDFFETARALGADIRDSRETYRGGDV